jgi:hypothetical protein
MVMATTARDREPDAAARLALGFDPALTIADAGAFAAQLARHGDAAPVPISSRSAATLAAIRQLSSTDFVGTGSAHP